MHYSVKGSNNMTGGCRRVVFYCISEKPCLLKCMNWLNKLEQKYGSKAIPNITRIFIAANLIGSVLLLTKGDVVLYYLQFSASAILHGQVWRLISWIFVPSGSISFLQLLFIFCLWTLETAWSHILALLG